MTRSKLLSGVLAVCLAGSSLGILPVSAGGTRVSVHDPSVIKDGQTYYVFGSHIDAAKSSDLINWKTFTNGYKTPNNVEFGDLSRNLAKAFAWAGENLGDCKGGFAVWAPDVIWNPDFQNADGSRGAYVMYFCTSSDYRTSVICFASSKNIEGPYNFGDTLIYSGFTDTDVMWEGTNRSRRYNNTNIDELIASGEVTFNNGWFNKHLFNNQMYPNAIDPNIYYGTDGRMYMTYGSWSGGIFTLEIDPKTGKCIHPKTGTTSDGRMVDSYFGTKIAGGYGKSGEGPFIEYNADTGYYYLWTVYGGLFSDGGYNMRVSRSRSPLGPFTDPAGNAAVLNSGTNLDSVGLKVMGNYKFSCLNKAYMACGHNSVLHDEDGRWYLLYHARFDDGSEYHEVRVHEMWFNEDGWPVVAPFEYAGDRISDHGYDEKDIVGEYEFINHGNSTDGKIISAQKINLNADGTVSGAVTGKWEQSPATPEATLVLGGKTYTGYFLAAKNEQGKMVMSFTAVGSNNQTVWGAKTEAYTGNKRFVYDYTNTRYDLVYNWDSVGEPGTATYVGDTGLLSGVSYYIINKNSGLSLDLPNGKTDDGTNIQQWDVNGSFAQQFRIIAEKDGWCRIASVGDESKVVAVASATAADGTNVELQTYTGADNQRFKVVKDGIYYAFLSKCSDAKSALDVFEWSKENGANISQYPYKAFDCQLFKVKPVCPVLNPGNYLVRNLETGETSLHKVVSKADSTASPNAIVSEDMRCNRDGSYSLAAQGTDTICVFEPSPAAPTEPTAEPTTEPTTVPEPGMLWGDVNASGTFELTDLVAMTRFLHGKGNLAAPEAGDMNRDGVLDIYDLGLMKWVYLNK